MEGISGILSRISDIQAQCASGPPNMGGGDFQALMEESGCSPTPPTMTTAQLGGQTLFNPAMLANVGNKAGNVRGEDIANAASKMDGTQYWSNACAHAVNDCLKNVGVDISAQVNNNPNWVPNYASLGQKVDGMADMKPGDLVIYNNYLGQGGFDHIGVYAGNGEAWNVSTAAGHKWVKTPIGNRFQEGRRIATS